MNLGAVYRAAGRLADAVASLREAVRLDPRSWSTHYNLAAALTANRDWEAAGASCRHSLQLHGGNAEALSLLGFILTEQGKPEEAAAHCQEAIRLAPGLAPAYNNLGTALVQLGSGQFDHRTFRPRLVARLAGGSAQHGQAEAFGVGNEPETGAA